MEESFALIVAWMLPKSLFCSMIIKKLSNLRFSKTFKHIGSSDTGWLLIWQEKYENVKKNQRWHHAIKWRLYCYFSIYGQYFQNLLFSVHLKFTLHLRQIRMFWIQPATHLTSLSKHHYHHDHFQKSIPMEIDVVNLRRI